MKNLLSNWVFLLACLSVFMAHSSNNLKVSNTTTYINLAPNSQILGDKNGLFTIDSIAKIIDSQQFKTFSQSLVDIYTESYWIKISLQNQSNTTNNWYMGFGNTNENVKLYEIIDGKINFVDSTGTNLAYSQKKIVSGKDDIIALSLASGKTKQYLVNIRNKTAYGKNLFGHTLAFFKIYAKEYYLKKDVVGRVFNAIFYGALGIMFLYNLLIAFSLKTKDYIVYVFFSFLFAWFNIFSDGYAYETILSGLPNNDRFYRILMLPVMLSSYLLFARIYLKSSLYSPKLDKIYYVFWGLLFATYIPGVVFGFWSITRSSMIIVTLCAMIFVFISSISSYKRGYKAAIYFILANTFLIISSILYSLNLAELLKVEFLVQTVDYQFQLSSAFEIGIFSLGLANRIKIAEKEKGEAQGRAIVALMENEKIIKSQNVLLEEKVKERTEELQLTLQELNHTLAEVEKEKQKSDQLLLNILPNVVATELKEYGYATPQYFEQATIIFADFVNFTHYAELQNPHFLINQLNELFHSFDEICERHNLEKIKTIGDCYMAVGGVPIANDTNAHDCINAALEMIQSLKGNAWNIRIGIHTGAVIAGVIGKHKFAYDIWGDAVNIASRMETASDSGRINITNSTYELVKDSYTCTYRGKILSKNKGELDMYFVEGLI